MSDFQIEIDTADPRVGYIACLSVTFGECRIDAGLRRDGRLKFPRGVRLPRDLRRSVTRTARRLVLAGLAEMWSRQV
jgi:hypothetical protein